MRDSLVSRGPQRPAPYPSSQPRVSPFIDPQDHTLVTLIASLYTSPIQELDGFQISIGGPTVRAWVRENEAIVGLRGTEVTNFSNLLDDAALAGVVDGACNLALVQQGKQVIDQLLAQGLSIKIGGHSLGGAAAFCLANQYPQLERIVALNPGAPPTGQGLRGTGGKCRAYHIVGDIISTHIDDSAAQVSRVHLSGETNWIKVGFYHSTQRFFESQSYQIWPAQMEQNDLEKYIFTSSLTSTFVTLLTGLVSKNFNKDRIREIVCKNPIPTTNIGSECTKDRSNPLLKTLGTAAGSGLGYVLGGKGGAESGSKIASEIVNGKGIADYFVNPETVNRFGKNLLSIGQYFNRKLIKYLFLASLFRLSLFHYLFELSFCWSNAFR